ncbi:MAG: prepilin peptidase [Casimicrobiaceae bacterium]|nr:prepilin peptidase [Casimicrobiaceae bacterium]MCX8098491.1 prepilin peptidase [Casimicrobiaceae bacterium]MDW8311594.1 prepilin peptidase [Burkholderiales bacterium]
MAFVLDPAVAGLAAGLLGLVIGSFLNVVIYRLPIMLERRWQREAVELRGEAPPEQPRFNLLVPPSRCPACATRIAVWDNIPVLSWLLLRGRCRACQARISPRYPLVEAMTGVLFALCVWRFGPTLQALAAMAFVAALLALAAIDLETQLLPDDLTLPLLWLGLLVNLGALFARLPDAVIGAAVGYLLLWSVYWIFRLLTGREGMGYGDFKLLGALGAWFGWQALPALLLLASVIGASVGILLILLKRGHRGSAIAFGPFLAFAGLVTLFFGDRLRSYAFG